MFRARFAAAFVLCALFGLAGVLAFAGQLKAGFHRPVYTQSRETQTCEKVGCAQVGDSAQYAVKGRVVSVSEPQPGVLCVQLQSTTQASQVCEPK